MADITTDPFSAVYEELWSLLEDSEEFGRRVAEGNRIKYIKDGDNTRDPEKDQMSTADFPEVRLVPAGIFPHLQRTSNSSSIVARYAIEIRSGDKRLNEAHFPVIWAVYRAMAPWAARLRELTWNDGDVFINLARPVGDVIEDMERGGDVSRGIEGWFAIWTVEVSMWFQTSAL